MKKQNYYTTGILLTLAILITSCLVYTDPVLQKADLFEPNVTGTDQDSIYMPSYYGDIGQPGVIEIKAKNNMKTFDAITFNLLYNPATYLSFPTNPLIFDGTTAFQNVASQKATVVQPGKLEVTIVLSSPIDISGVTIDNPATHKTLFKIKTDISLNAPEGQEITINFNGGYLSNEGTGYDFPIPSSFITVTGKMQATEFKELTVSSIVPNKTSNKTEANIVFSGTHLDLVHEAWIGKSAQKITNKTPTSLTVKIPANALTPDDYYITFYDKAQNEFSVKTPLTITDEVVQVQEDEPPLKEAAPVIVPSTDSPKIVTDKTYTTPTLGINDGKTPLSLYVLIQDKNNDIKSVIADLTKIGQIGPQSPGNVGQTAKDTCPTGSNFIVCMEPTVKEGQTGQWFVLSNITISTSVMPSATPYKVDVTVKDEKGNTDKRSVSVFVGDLKTASTLKPIAAVSTSKTSIEVLFSKPMAISTTGKGFTITASSDVNDKLNVTHASMNAAGTVVTLTTADQTIAKKYVLNLSAEIKDAEGKVLSASKLPFDGFQALKSPPVVNYISSTGVNKVELEFQKNLKLSSIADTITKIYETENTVQKLNVMGIKVISGKKLEIETANQIPERDYRIDLKDLASYDGTVSPSSINKGFKGFNLKFLNHAATAQKADFNNDGRVDFADFTIFSSVYGTVYFGEGENVNDASNKSESQAAGATQPPTLTPNPDSLVPHTSEPKGGNI